MLVTETQKGPFGITADIAYTYNQVISDFLNPLLDPTAGCKGSSIIGAFSVFVIGFLLVAALASAQIPCGNINASHGYHWTKTYSTTTSYRYPAVDYVDETFVYDVSQDGIILVFSWPIERNSSG